VIDRVLRLNIGAALGLCFLLLMAVFAVTGQIGRIGIDNDDVMRLAQIRDFLGGQNWYDHQQYRMGLEGGTLMHWSRVIDAPVIALILLLDIILPYELAEAAAISLWPVATGLALVLAVKLLSRDNSRYIVQEGDLARAVWGFGLLIILLLLITFYRFSPGRLDHHNIQFAALALSYVGLSDPQVKPKRFALAGAMTGLSLVVGTEALPFLAVNCGFAALLWGYKGAAVSRPVAAFGLAFAAVICTGFLIDTPPSAYGQIYCDILAVNYAALGLAGGLGLALLSQLKSLDSLLRRAVGLGVLGAICGGILLILSPECLSNPLGQLPDNVQHFWLDYVEEAQPLISKKNVETGSIFYFIGLILTAWGVSLWRYKRLGFTPARIYGLVLSGLIIAMTLYQLRYASFGLIIGSLMLIPWVAERFVEGKAKSKDSVAYIFAFALSAASLWQMPAYIIGDGNAVAPNTDVSARALTNAQAGALTNAQAGDGDTTPRDVCFPEALKSYLKSLPPQRILAEPNLTSAILYNTAHSAVNGNYHRNAAGIDRAVDIFMTPPARAAEMMRADKTELLIFCQDRAAYDIYAKAAPKGLAGELKRGAALAGFVKIPLDTAGMITVWTPE
jgi:hypothetical protein